MERQHHRAQIHMAFKLMPIRKIAINSSCAPTEPWRLSSVKMDCCLMARAMCTTTATTTGLLNAVFGSMTVSRGALSLGQSINRIPLYSTSNSNLKSRLRICLRNLPGKSRLLNIVLEVRLRCSRTGPLWTRFGLRRAHPRLQLARSAAPYLQSWRYVEFLHKIHLETHWNSLQLSLDSRAPSKWTLIHQRPDSGHSHDLPFKVTDIVS